MLDTGIDIPEILNLVFFKKVRSKSKFWQMIGRGTRLCTDLLGVGLNKEQFYIFDFCTNFEFFRANPKGMESKGTHSLTERIFNTKVDILRELQDIKYQEEDYIHYRKEILRELLEDVRSLNRENFRVKLHERYVEIYKNNEPWNALGTGSVADIKEYISPLITPLNDDELAKRFDCLIYTVDLAYLQNKNATKPIKAIINTAEQLSKLGTIPKVMEQKHIIEKVLTDEFWESADILDLEEVRNALRDLIRFIEKDGQKIYYTNFKDEILEINENGAMYNSNDLKDYKKKVEHYLKEHKDELAIYKLRNNKKLTKEDMKTLERILWKDLGSKAEYEKEYGNTPVTKLVRKIVGLQREAANEAFSKFLSEENLNVIQIRFVKLIVDYIVANGIIEDNRVLMEEPFRSLGSITSLFKDNINDAREIMNVITDIKNNCEQIS